MTRRTVLAFLMLAAACLPLGAQTEKTLDLERHFEGTSTGCFVLLDMKNGQISRYNARRAAARLTPCSTFKIFNTMAGLQTGAVKDETTVFQWDGTPQRRKEVEKDFTLEGAFKTSVVWYYQKVASLVGEKRMLQLLNSASYGNRDMTGGLTQFWLQSSLKISADEQVAFLRRLYRNQLPFSRRTMDITRKIMVQIEEKGNVLSGKTGSGEWEDNSLGWFVGHVKTADGREYVFATNAEAPSGMNGMKAREITLNILDDLGIMKKQN